MSGPREPDVLVVGGGLVGAAIAFGLMRAGRQVTVLDEGDIALRASRGNFALVWVQSKGLGMPAYADWTRGSAAAWPTLARELGERTGVDVALRQPGGFTLSLSDAELDDRADAMRRLHNQPAMAACRYEVLDHAATRQRLPMIGPAVAGSVYCPLDGHVNSLRLFRALHQALAAGGADYRPERPVEVVHAAAGGFAVAGAWGELRAPMVVLAAGLGNARLAPMVGLAAPVRPSKGQIIVTEKLAPFLPYPVVTLRQTDEGGVMIGDSQEDAGLDTTVRPSILSAMAARAVAMFPLLAGASVVRTWSALRVMSPDGFPIYEQSAAHPGAFVVTCHSGVTLAAAHALTLAPWIAEGRLPARLDPFRARRLDVPTAA